VLLAVSERVLRSQACTDAYRSDFAAGDQICSLGVPIGNGQHASSCYGDSGGPVVGAGRRGRHRRFNRR
jgi:secreted trypsin-like serine protease